MPVRSRAHVTVALLCVIGVASLLSLTSSAFSARTLRATSPGKNDLIAFRRYSDASKATSALFSVAADGSSERRLTDPPTGAEDTQPDWSPDGSLIAFHRSGAPYAIYTVRRDGSGLTRISPACSYSGPNVEAHCEDGEGAHFLPDGTGVMYTRVTGKIVNGSLVLRKDIAVRDLDGGNLRTVIPMRKGYDCYEGQFAPNGKRLLYVCSVTDTNHAIFVARADGTGRRQITPWSLDAGDDPDWSPDGKWILFRSFEASAHQPQIHVVHPDGTGLRKLTRFSSGTTVGSSSFSPDGRQIVFVKKGLGGEPDIFVMRADGRDIRPLTRTKLWDSAPDWGPAVR